MYTMVTIYKSYDDEPEDVFLPLSEEMASEFYAAEMDSYTEDIDFFEPLLPRHSPILELGCGTGRITRKIAKRKTGDSPVIGIDTSLFMLKLATQREDLAFHRKPHYLCMDMTQLGFSIRFGAILIPYNTLNLLCSKERIMACLSNCRDLLQPGGKLLLHLFAPADEFVRQKKTFQFQMFDRKGGGKIIKEIVKQYDPQSQLIEVEERFRVRPMQKGAVNEDWRKSYSIACFSSDQWLKFFNLAGFTPKNIYSDFKGQRYQTSTSSTLIADLRLYYIQKRLSS